MSIDQNLNAPSAEPSPVSAIENEIPAYRAISPGAVVSLVLGILAILAYANLLFLIFAALAVVVGVLSDRKIQRLPEVLTGRGLAQAGIALGLIFGLTAFTITAVQGFLLKGEAAKFARQYQDVLTKGSLNDAIFISQTPEARKGTTPDKLVAEMKKSMQSPQMMDMQTQSVQAIKAALAADPKADFHFDQVESTGEDGTDYYATALYELHRTKPKTPDEKITFALAYMKSRKVGGKYEWWVQELRYPYVPDSFVPPTKAADDGHGHAH